MVETDFSNKLVYRYQHCGEYFYIVLLFSTQPGEFPRVVPNALVYSCGLVRLDQRGGGGGGVGEQHSIRPSTFFFLYLNHPTKLDVTSGLIGAQKPVSAKSNHGVWVRHDFYGFLSHPCQEL